MNASLLLVDDDKAFQLLADEALTAEGFEVRSAGTLARALGEVASATPDVVILDRRLPDGDGLELLAMLRPEGVLCIVVTAYGDVENAVEALRAGAWDYLTKPVQLADLVVKLHKALERRGLKDRLAIARSSAAGPPPIDPTSPAMKHIVDVLASVAQSPLTPVLFTGPSGSGKQRAAELLHELTFAGPGKDQDAPFMQVNCAALPENLIENELFGHEKGAFTDARTTQRGLIEMAAGGTLFLDEIADMPLRSQAKLLKFLDGMRVRRLGGQREISVELRVIAATNQDIHAAVRAGRFREDLYHRLSVFSIAVPPLAKRKDDIPDLARSFVRFFAARIKKRLAGISSDALAALTGYEWPGNVRELRNAIERAVILTPGPEITRRDLMFPSEGPANGGGFFQTALRGDGSPPLLEEMERAYVKRVLEHCHGHRTAAAQALGISYPTFLKRLRELGLE